MGDKTLSFVEKALDYAHQYPALCPLYLNVAEFDVDMIDALPDCAGYTSPPSNYRTASTTP
jgi:hypothetical protein